MTSRREWQPELSHKDGIFVRAVLKDMALSAKRNFQMLYILATVMTASWVLLLSTRRTLQLPIIGSVLGGYVLPKVNFIHFGNEHAIA